MGLRLEVNTPQHVVTMYHRVSEIRIHRPGDLVAVSLDAYPDRETAQSGAQPMAQRWAELRLSDVVERDASGGPAITLAGVYAQVKAQAEREAEAGGGRADLWRFAAAEDVLEE